MNNLNKFLADHPEIGENFLSLNQGLIAEIRQRFIDSHEADDLFSRYLMCLVLQEVLLAESAISKQLLQQALQDRGINNMGDAGTC